MEFSLVFLVCLVTTAAAQTTESSSACGDTSYYGPSGVIGSPNYPYTYDNDLYCDYDVYAPEGSSLSLLFKSFNIEYSYDSVTISCPTNSSFSPLEYSGNSIPGPVSIPWCSKGRVNLQTDKNIVYSGFSLDYYVNVGGCGNTVYNDSHGYLTSPNWPSNYSSNLDCNSIIWAPQRNNFHLEFNSFDLQTYCTYDWLEIKCLDNSDYGPFRYCGTFANYTLYVKGCSQVLLWFHSDNSENYQGFNIKYNVYPDEACGNTSYHGPSGVISSPNHPGNYYDNLSCHDDVYASEGSSLSFFFKSFNTEYLHDSVTISCPTNSSFSPQQFSGGSLPGPVSVPWCSQGLVRFQTDQSIVSTGFSLDYFVSSGGCGNTVYNDSNGYVTSPNYPSYYGYSHNCSNIIWAPQQSTFNLYFQSFNLHSCCDCDWMEISCLDNSEYGQYRFCGNYDLYEMYIYRCSQVLLWFHSDGSDNDQGFNIQYNVIPDADRKEPYPKTRSN